MVKTKTLVIVSVYFNPIHKGHIEYLTRSKELGDEIFVIVNNDIQRKLKGSKEFMDENERKFILDHLNPVDKTFISFDTDRVVNKTLERIYELYRAEFDRFIFSNGGDQTSETIGEKEVCERLGIQMVFGLGEKIQSSSWLLEKY
jgi:D-beta-D-heptose 7-phosphate kinase/D-beta-D-heptose 1-phosphate adenosyltransferase